MLCVILNTMSCVTQLTYSEVSLIWTMKTYCQLCGYVADVSIASSQRWQCMFRADWGGMNSLVRALWEWPVDTEYETRGTAITAIIMPIITWLADIWASSLILWSCATCCHIVSHAAYGTVHYTAETWKTVKAYIPENTKNCIAFVQCRTNVEDVGPTLYKCYTNVFSLCPPKILFFFLQTQTIFTHHAQRLTYAHAWLTPHVVLVQPMIPPLVACGKPWSNCNLGNVACLPTRHSLNSK